jgi:mono/diheme cytochrome c family protein
MAMNRTRACHAGTAAFALAVVASCATPEHTQIPRLEVPPAPASFDARLVERGAELAAAGNCRGCHTPPGARAFSGGLPLKSPFGTIYTSNITPDAETGIGRWSEEAFRRAMREGIGRNGEHLYPAFPYDHYTLVTDADDRAIYAYLMTRPAVSNRPPRNELLFPFNLRESIGAWKKLYLHPGPYQPDPAHDAVWNRGKYITEGLGHCSACHSPRNAAQAEKRDRHMDGGEAEGWHAYALNERSAAPDAWTVEAMHAYLRKGWVGDHGVSRGPMAGVTRELAKASDADVRAMSVYVVSLMGNAQRSAPPPKPAGSSRAARIYEGACVLCHDGDDPLPFGGIALERSIGISGEDARNPANVILYGLPAAEGQASPVMPGYAGALSDAELVELLGYLRARFSDRPAWSDLAKQVAEARRAGPEIARQSAGGTGSDPARVAEGR